MDRHDSNPPYFELVPVMLPVTTRKTTGTSTTGFACPNILTDSITTSELDTSN